MDSAEQMKADLERMKAEFQAKMAALVAQMNGKKDEQKPDEKPSEPAPEPADEQEQTAPAPEAHTDDPQNAPQTEPEAADNKADEPDAEAAEAEPTEEPDEPEAEQPDGENTPPDPAKPEDNKDSENKTDEKPADKPEEEKPPKWEWKATNPTEEMMKAYFDKNASPELRAKVEGKKTIQGAYKHCAEWAKKQITEAMMKAARSAGLSGVLVQGRDEDLMCEMIHYFEEDSLNCEWKPTPKPSHNKPTMHPLPTEMPKPAPKKPDPQMTLFDF